MHPPPNPNHHPKHPRNNQKTPQHPPTPSFPNTPRHLLRRPEPRDFPPRSMSRPLNPLVRPHVRGGIEMSDIVIKSLGETARAGACWSCC